MNIKHQRILEKLGYSVVHVRDTPMFSYCRWVNIDGTKGEECPYGGDRAWSDALDNFLERSVSK